ncbi:MAG TPA: DNA polymerase III subunit gamma/tau [Gemmatales bacterium]|nr:DNA polymerase III subunit gamma/tau [Gemmatales bacterium]HMP59268.1 DNA polymerase III subunit gamma/tau [Gemmatales bacterium]
MAKKATKPKVAETSGAAPPATLSLPNRAAGDYTVVARRYRPGRFSDLVGQEAIAQALTHAIESSRVAHAYLFTGARGVGKTSTARILARALNCETGPSPHPCGRCEACQAIAVGEDVDVIEIDGASNNKVEEVRELRQNAQYRPQRSRFKIYIIDEVHMLTTSAFNALLKTLEEPPPHVKFIFATTEVNKIPVTILSRCQRYDFGSIRTPQIKQRLREIVDHEGMQADDDALALIAKRGSGSMRDAQSLLDQALAFSTGKLAVADVHRLLGTASEERLAALAECILSRQPATALPRLDEILAGSVQPGELLEQLVELWRQLLLLKTLGAGSPLVELPEDLRPRLAAWVEKLAPDTLLHGLDILLAAKGRLRLTTHGRVVLEMAVLRLSQLADLVPLAELSQLLAGSAAGGDGRLVMPPTARITAPPATERAARPEAPTEEVENAATSAADGPVPWSNDYLTVIWSAVTKAGGLALQGDLQKVVRQNVQPPNVLTITFPAGCARERERCQAPDRVERIQRELKRVTGLDVQVRFEIGTEAAVAPVPSETGPSPRQRIGQDPLVKAAIDQLGAQLMHFDPDFGLGESRPASSG